MNNIEKMDIATDTRVEVQSALDYMTGNNIASAVIAYLAWGVISFIILLLMWGACVLSRPLLGQVLSAQEAILVSRVACAILTAVFIVRLSNQPCFEYGWRIDAENLTLLRPFHCTTVYWSAIASTKLVYEDWNLRIWISDSVISSESQVSGVVWILRKIFGFAERKRIDVNLSNMHNVATQKSILINLRKYNKAEGIRLAHGSLVSNPKNEPDIEQPIPGKKYYSVEKTPEIDADKTFGQINGWGVNAAILLVPGLLIGLLFVKIASSIEVPVISPCFAFSLGYLLTSFLIAISVNHTRVDANAIYLQTPLFIRIVPWDQILHIDFRPAEPASYMDIALHSGKRITCMLFSPVVEYAVCCFALKYHKADRLLVSEYVVSLHTPIPDNIPDEMVWEDHVNKVTYAVDKNGVRIRYRDSLNNNYAIYWNEVDEVEFVANPEGAAELSIYAGRKDASIPCDIAYKHKDPKLHTPENMELMRKSNILVLAAIKHIRSARPDIPVGLYLDLLKSVE
jgi:hypothetical protein